MGGLPRIPAEVRLRRQVLGVLQGRDATISEVAKEIPSVESWRVGCAVVGLLDRGLVERVMRVGRQTRYRRVCDLCTVTADGRTQRCPGCSEVAA